MHSRQTNRSLSCATLFIFVSTSLAITGFKYRTEQPPGTGQELFKHHCIHCHGADGTKGFFGAKNLKKSILSDSAIALQIRKGKGFMPSFRKKVTPDEINQLVSFVKSLRN